MADTTYLKQGLEPYVRMVLAKEYEIQFRSRVLNLITGGTHEFDAVSEDGRIVVSIKSASGKTANGKNPSGKIKDVLAELYFLTLVDAPVRMIVLTNGEFFEIMSRALRGRLVPGLSLKLIALPPDIQERVQKIQKEASDEVSPVKENVATV